MAWLPENKALLINSLGLIWKNKGEAACSHLKEKTDFLSGFGPQSHPQTVLQRNEDLHISSFEMMWTRPGLLAAVVVWNTHRLLELLGSVASQLQKNLPALWEES